MKLLRNPIFTTGLVIVALATVFYQLIIPRMRTGRPFLFSARSGSPTVGPVLPNPGANAIQRRAEVKKGARQALPTAGVDREYVEVHFNAWVDYPARDPFFLATPNPDETPANTETNSPVPTWKLRAILALTGSRMAVINRGWYHEGDEIEGYRIDKIDTGGVWFVGPREKERLGFDTRPRAVATNAPPAPSPQPVPPNLIKP